MDRIKYTSLNADYNKIGKLLKEGNLIIYPTDTVYGVGGIIESDESIAKIYKAKERSFKSPLIVLVSDVSKIEKIAYIEEKNREKIEKLIKEFWPGGLTIILNKKDNVPDIMVSGGKTVGVRMPNLDTALKIIEAAGGLLPTTSANISGETTPRSYDELSEEFKERVEILVDGGRCPIGNASTIIDMSDKPKILRTGAISIEDIEKIIGKLNGEEIN
ncbi:MULTISPECIES: L-threonylcarbamoyladenylate synthase [Fusobacterium]|jgi:L-threonylcarbamoyladenylate synthase|uniref:L-threonylcarbamoyladenylate synthase n=1 Tax=Fusobacterium varium ATCC 27725 TaxID=469618 RepID=A0ABN5JDP5_FUSVA|nr:MULTISPECIES: L-threonylcarbamoyladenylate synthase [Fusobacterium]AVQ30186.1 threonylcarbamoyl-AMP synthase [Fusobacterium varium ATCC 27725]EES64784.1 Sua5/YciO/YrdC/YwlC family protein [Fusobacterium varium ATCC 27725]MCF2671918.1 threonylcarbamoyl-AMP synthase [Fusobacterium varium]MCI6031333.1 threonylcarbamoyl-AMP synthase [Fusobacterium varium]MDY4005617.1 L-threonylcarbamoyladenylate synthase [Fusobacterium varium]